MKLTVLCCHHLEVFSFLVNAPSVHHNVCNMSSTVPYKMFLVIAGILTNEEDDKRFIICREKVVPVVLYLVKPVLSSVVVPTKWR